VTSDFRLVAATNRDLESMVGAGEFRQDLLFRLRSLCIALPPLRDRIPDINEIVRFHLHRLGERQGVGAKGFSPEFFAALQTYEWPGNVRELVNALESALAAAGPVPTLFPLHLPSHIRVSLARASVSCKPEPPTLNSADMPASSLMPKMQEVREKALSAIEKQYLTALLSHTGGDMELACRISGLSKPRLYALFKQYRLSRNG
jgi:two-component system, NtrC family, response regulator